MKIGHLTVFLSLFFFLGCVKEKEPLLEFDRYENTPKGNFQAFWDGMSRRYAFWGYDPTDWDAMYDKYAGQVTDETTELELAEIFEGMVENLIDSHYDIFVEIDGQYGVIRSKQIDKKLLNYHYLLDSAYFEGPLFSRLSPSTRKKFAGFVYGVINNKYQYIRIPQFNVFETFAENSEFFLDMLNFIANPAPQYKGVIIDLRFNPGGFADEVPLFVGNFTEKELLLGHSRYKYGNNRNEFGPWIPVKIFPSSIGYNPLPVVVLCDGFSISAAERTTMAFSLLPQVTVLGDRTFGAHAPLLTGSKEARDITYAGQFILPNGWEVTTGVEVFRHADGNVYEGIGFPPDAVVPFDVNLFKTTGRDNQLEQALQRLPQ